MVSDGDSPAYQYRKERIAHWDRVAQTRDASIRWSAFYHAQLRHYYGFLVPPGLKVLEIGCGCGDLLASLNPSFGVGVDFSRRMIHRAVEKHPHLSFFVADAHNVAFTDQFDIIVLSDLVNDLWDVQATLENVRFLSHPWTRIVINFYNNFWRLPLSIVKYLKLGAFTLEQNWLAPRDIFNLLRLSGLEGVKYHSWVLFPLRVPFVSAFANRYLVNFWPFKWLALTNFIVARPVTEQAPVEEGWSPSVSVVVAARNEAGNIEPIFQRIPKMGGETELVFVEGHSIDNTYETIEKTMVRYPDVPCRLFRQSGHGKGDAVRLGFEKARGEVLMILDRLEENRMLYPQERNF